MASRHSQLPVKLGKEPLIDVVFELRFDGVSAGDILPGLLYSKLPGEKRIERLPVSDIPAFVRAQDPNLASQALVKLIWGNYLILIGDGMLAVGCVMPYPGWKHFRAQIFKVIHEFVLSDIATKINRFAIKYVDLLENLPPSELSSTVAMSLSVGGVELGKLPFQLNAEFDVGGFRHVLQLAVPAQVQLTTGQRKHGLVLSIDTLVNEVNAPPNRLIALLEEVIDPLHNANKEAFFNCLTAQAINKLEPTYATT